jgi:hypothetical protein
MVNENMNGKDADGTVAAYINIYSERMTENTKMSPWN